MKVLHLVKTSVGGAFAYLQMRELARMGVEVHAALPADGPRIDAYRAAGIHVHELQTDLPVMRPWQWFTTAHRLRQLVLDVDPQLIHSHFVGPTLTARLALGREHATPRVFQVPGPLHLEHGLFRRLDLATAGTRDSWIATCQWVRHCYLAAGIPATHLGMSYYGTDLDSVPAVATGKLRRELGVPPDTKLVGMVAYMYAPKLYLGQTAGLKGHEDLIDAVALCLEREPNLFAVLIGGGWNGATGYERRVRRYGQKRLGERVRFLGTRHDALELYADLDLAVHPSHSENVGGAVESLLSGVPTIATDVGGLPDLVRPGETGWLVPARSPRELADAILAALADPALARRRAAAGQKLARDLFDVRTTARQVHDFYGHVLNDGVSHPAPSRERASQPRVSKAPAIQLALKRTFDVVVSAVGLLLLAPLLLVIAAIIRWTMGAPVLFRHQRPGRHGQPFMLLKFRTMNDARDAEENLLPEDRRVTRLGRILRTTSLDELPELLNVLRGDMSLVGPRPLLMEYLDRYTPEQARRHVNRPGITGWAQVNGRNELPWDQRLALDVWYVDHYSLWLDLKILWLTVATVLLQRGMIAHGNALMPDFRHTEAPWLEAPDPP